MHEHGGLLFRRRAPQGGGGEWIGREGVQGVPALPRKIPLSSPRIGLTQLHRRFLCVVPVVGMGAVFSEFVCWDPFPLQRLLPAVKAELATRLRGWGERATFSRHFLPFPAKWML